MTDKYLSTDSYKGVRDFYPEEAAIQQYIFSTWAKTAESFGFERYDASILEPADLYKAKGAENEEMVNEQTYTFQDRGEREVTLRPEMTPTVARMVAGKSRELAFPLRWYSIPNLFRYERPQKGRLREHWQFNVDIFGSTSLMADIEVISLAYHTLINFGFKREQFKIVINDRQLMERLYTAVGIKKELIPAITRLNDKKNKISRKEYIEGLNKITNNKVVTEEIIMLIEKSDEQTDVVFGLSELGITNVIFDKSLARGFDYYTGTIFEVFALDSEGKTTGRSILGGGRYDNLTGMFGGEAISGVGFGMGDVALKDWLGTSNLLPADLGFGAEVIVIPTEAEFILASEKIAQKLRGEYSSVTVDLSGRSLAKQLASADKRGARFVAVIGENEIESKTYILLDLKTREERKCQL